MSHKIIRVGIAGFGMSGKIFHAPFLHADDRFQIKRVYERSKERSKEEYPYVEVVRSFEELLVDDIDLIVISTPNSEHYTMAKQALKRGMSVIVEKPVAIHVEEAQELQKIAKANNVLFTVYQSRRLDGDFLTVKELIQNETLGELLDYEAHFDRFVRTVSSKAWKATGGKGVNILYDLGVHIIDQAYVLFGMPNAVYADFRKQRATTKDLDNFNVILYYDQLRVVLSAGQLVLRQGPHYRLNGRKGSFVKYGMDVQEQALVDGQRPPQDKWGMEPESAYGILYLDQGGHVSHETIKTHRGDYGFYYDNIYKAMTEGEELLVKPEEAIQVLMIIEAAEKSAAEGRRIDL